MLLVAIWVYKIKRRAYSNVESYKGCLITKEFTQQEDIEYLDTFSLIVKPTTIHLVLTIVIY